MEPDGRLRLLVMQRVARLGLERVSVLAGSAEQLVLADHMVGVAHARFAYFFGPGCEPGLAELARVIRPGGTAFIVDDDWRTGPLRPGWPAPRGVAGPIRTVSKRSGTSRASRRPGWRASAGSTAERTWRRCWATSSRPSWPSSPARSTRPGGPLPPLPSSVLSRRHVDLLGARVQVVEQAAEVAGKIIVSPPKTGAGRRGW